MTGDDVAEVLRRRFFTPDSIRDSGSFRPHVTAAVGNIAVFDEETKRGRQAAEDRFLQSYPFHPAITDIFYSRWTQLEGSNAREGSCGRLPLPCVTPRSGTPVLWLDRTCFSMNLEVTAYLMRRATWPPPPAWTPTPVVHRNGARSSKVNCQRHVPYSLRPRVSTIRRLSRPSCRCSSVPNR